MTDEQFIDIPEGATLYPLRPDGRADLTLPMVCVDGDEQVPVCAEDSVCYEVKTLGEYYVYFKPEHAKTVEAAVRRGTRHAPAARAA